MTTATILVFLVMSIGITVALGAFWWAAKDKQFENIEEGASCIFDESEPVGEPTDSFPGKPPGERANP